ncbi:solute carrier family 52, riboflavin transporter, member 3-B-like [Ylistrum balloti]|uniref:solute carrier family 52, riboflavin transporter, member 3-B-like n=1 Tax=Ylistrum balloti TaxID=509963 RepID=UPI002905E92D|nr:solute carrier family 52, riboflavin transporter, member 3-B-like [Ylistrum balloti]XP_060069409.1 solute carrier family 52, riboflavin transporter, member 3-B-like [Ylistrum balloti]
MTEGKCCNRFGEVNIFVYFLVALFGIASWLAVNGLWVELPVMVPHLPEGWKLPSYLTVITQLANIGPILVTIWYVCCKSTVPEKTLVYVILVVGAASCLLLVFFWKNTSYIAGTNHSLALLVLQFFLASVDCMSSVLFLPFMSTFKAQYMSGLYIGEGLSGLIPSLVALGQGVGKMTCQNISVIYTTTNISHNEILPVYQDPSFPVEHFFYFLFAMLVMSGTAFTLLNYLPYCKREHVTAKEPVEDDDTFTESYTLNNDFSRNYTTFSDTLYNPSAVESSSQTLLINKGKPRTLDIFSDSFHPTVPYQRKIEPKTYVFLLIMIGWINALGNGVLPSIQTYSCLPYGSNAYHLSATLSSIANPVACLVVFLLPVSSTLVIGSIVLLGSCLAAFIMLTAVQSPTPVLYDSAAGPGLMVTTWILLVLSMTYSKVSIATLFRSEGRKALFWCGVVTQIGSTFGAVVTYILVNETDIFQSAPDCP